METARAVLAVASGARSGEEGQWIIREDDAVTRIPVNAIDIPTGITSVHAR